MEGTVDGVLVGFDDGTQLGSSEGAEVGDTVGIVDGVALGTTEGTAEGASVGTILGILLGTNEGVPDGVVLGAKEGTIVGSKVGTLVGLVDGKLLDGTEDEGAAVGAYCEQTSVDPLPESVSYRHMQLVGAGLTSSPSAVDELYEGHTTQALPFQYLSVVHGSTVCVY